MANELKCWAVADKSSGEGDSSFRIIYDKNDTDEEQTAVFEVVSEDGSIVREIRIKQSPREVFLSAQKQGVFTRDNCAADEKGSEILYVVPAGRYRSYISQEDADNQAEEDLLLYGQQTANEEGTCTTYIWYNKQLSDKFRKDCGEGNLGSEVEYIVEAGKHSSLISQEDADRKAREDIRDNGQKYANDNGKCSNVYTNKEISGDFERTNCPSGEQGTTVKYVVESGKYISLVSQDDADKQAQDDLRLNGPKNANEKGECLTIYYNERKSGIFQKECELGTGSFVEYVVEAGEISSIISQIDADQKAEKKVQDEGQAYANEHGECSKVYFSKEVRVTKAKDDCVEGEGKENTYIVEAGKYSSEISQDDADKKAEDDAELNAQRWINENTGCLITYLSVEKRGTFEKEGCPAPQKGSEVEYIVEAGAYTSTVSQSAADKLAEDDVRDNGQAYANEHGTCIEPYWNEEKSVNKTKNDCPQGKNGTSVKYTVPAHTYYSFESQDEANSLADKDIADNAQAYANERGECVDMYLSREVSGEFQRENCGSGMVGTTVTYTIEAGRFASDISQDDADNEALRHLAEEGPTYANKNGDCLYMSDAKTATFTKECPDGQVGTEVEYTMPQGAYTHPDSTALANAERDKHFQTKGQEYANAQGQCLAKYWNVAITEDVYPDCSEGAVAQPVSYTVEANKYWSTESQKDADDQAKNEIATKGKEYANEHGECWYLSEAKSADFYSENCGDCQEPRAYNYSVPQGWKHSTISLAEANELRDAEFTTTGQAAANKENSCQAASTSPTWTDTGSTRCEGCTSQKQQKDTNACSSSYDTTRWVSGGGRSCTDWEYYGSGSCVGHTLYDAYKDNCSGSVDNTYAVSCYDCCNCGSYGSWEYYCYGEDRWRRRYDDCGNEDDELYESCSSSCGCTPPCDPNSWSNTGSATCRNGVSQIQQVNDCGDTRWVDYGTACSATNDTRYCKSGCLCDTCVETGTVSGSGSTTNAAITDANNKAKSKADSMSCEEYWNVYKYKDFTRNTCESGCTGSTVRVECQAGTFKECTQAEADYKAETWIDRIGQSEANEHGTCNCPQGQIYIIFSFSSTISSITSGTLTISGPTTRSASLAGETSVEFLDLPFGTYTVSFSGLRGECVSGSGETELRVTSYESPITISASSTDGEGHATFTGQCI